MNVRFGVGKGLTRTHSPPRSRFSMKYPVIGFELIGGFQARVAEFGEYERISGGSGASGGANGLLAKIGPLSNGSDSPYIFSVIAKKN